MTIEETIILLTKLLNKPHLFRSPSIYQADYAPYLQNLMDEKLLDRDGNLTERGRALAISRSKGMHFEKEATRRGLRCGIAMSMGALTSIEKSASTFTDREVAMARKFLNKANKKLERIESNVAYAQVV